MKALWNGAVIAESDDTVVVENNHYFPSSALKEELIKPSDHSSYCPWKGTAAYFHIEVDGQQNANAVWIYPDPKPAAAEIRDRAAFWNGVEVTN